MMLLPIRYAITPCLIDYFTLTPFTLRHYDYFDDA